MSEYDFLGTEVTIHVETGTQNTPPNASVFVNKQNSPFRNGYRVLVFKNILNDRFVKVFVDDKRG